jgi:prepilin-type N-terminal cleavage/methylation domain-containing protein
MFEERQNGDRGFTLVEIVIAIVLVGVLSAVVVVGVGRLNTSGSTAACQASADAARAAVTTHFAQTGSSPASLSEMVASGSLVLPSGVAVDPSGLKASAATWQLTMAIGTSATFTCSDATGTPVVDQVAQAPAMTEDPTMAFALRRVSEAYTGPAVRVRRSSDGREVDIGFGSDGELDLAALTAHVGAGDGFVTTWYDQSGNSRHATSRVGEQQPRLVTAGVVEREGSRPAMRWMGSTVDTRLQFSYPSGPVEEFTFTIVHREKVRTRNSGFVINSSNWVSTHLPWSNGYVYLDFGGNTGASRIYASVGSDLDVPRVVTFRNSVIDNSKSIVINGATVATGTGTSATSTGTLVIGSGIDGVIAEVIVFQSALTPSDRAVLERDLGARFGITIGG